MDDCVPFLLMQGASTYEFHLTDSLPGAWTANMNCNWKGAITAADITCTETNDGFIVDLSAPRLYSRRKSHPGRFSPLSPSRPRRARLRFQHRAPFPAALVRLQRRVPLPVALIRLSLRQCLAQLHFSLAHQHLALLLLVYLYRFLAPQSQLLALDLRLRAPCPRVRSLL
jgi:hypothetical protein